ncbi:MAG: alpha-E domain-containing protein [Acidimicrobiales bacterium]
MLARHAESLFWTGRYVERAEDTARMLDVTYHGLLEAAPYEAERAWRDLLAVLRLESVFDARGWGVDAVSVSEFLVLDDDNPGSIIASVANARENVRTVRELIPTELWESINRFHLDLRARNLRADLEQQPYVLYGAVKRGCQSVAGVASETMPRDDGWRFLQLGWMLERAEMTCRLLDVQYAATASGHAGDGDRDGDRGPASFHHWSSTLKSASASEAYRKAFRSSMEVADVVDFLLLSETFPRSVLFCLRRAETDLARLDPNQSRLSRPRRLLGRVRADLEYRDLHEVLADGLHPFLDGLQRSVRQVAEAVALQYFRNSQEFAVHALDFHPAG